MSDIVYHDTHSPTATLKILQLSDPHLLSDVDQVFAGVQPYRLLEKVIEHAHQHAPFDCVLSTGDIAQETSKQTYQSYLDAVQTLNIPHYWIRGNHDDDDSFPSQTVNDEPQTIIFGQWCFILLNSQVNKEVYGYLKSEHLAQVKSIIEKHPQHHVLIALHHHTFAVGCAWLDPQGLKNPDDFLAAIESYPNVKLVICGHVHQVSYYRHQHIDFLSSPSTCVQFKPHSEKFSLDTLTAGYRILELHPDGTYTTEIHRLDEHLGEVDLSLSEY